MAPNALYFPRCVYKLSGPNVNTSIRDNSQSSTGQNHRWCDRCRGFALFGVDAIGYSSGYNVAEVNGNEISTYRQRATEMLRRQILDRMGKEMLTHRCLN